ncbi:hypothetical protein GUITHDRAFT_142671 [Guillardia theta CCMP2712]|uniref:Uncharacterized protein n=1 Tax=Guillardia theta (strain CCMP2712) TaxID=905079 RepID=L1IWS8_GUITC|nr:hypothetical protein GUITHDRAFT_142671 [Guillardia theta CCMP2712]EKX40572.1 hypothetical protein GUITHDRAFT_142671 [Guillardia theta CCMP2712]|eukprot:XP_005827552.1 hypothetical protein GUITHDRAFT_142671 [Guillardia theta CCMP2712]
MPRSRHHSQLINSLCKCRHGPSRWLSSNPITPSVCKLVLGKHTDREISLAMEHFAQVGQCQCGKQVILCKYCPLTGDMLAESAPKHIGQRLPNPITFDNRATRHVVESHSSGVYHRYWKGLHDEMLSEEKMLSEGAWRGGGADGMDPLASSPVSSCVTGFGSFETESSETDESLQKDELLHFLNSPRDTSLDQLDDAGYAIEEAGCAGSMESRESQELDRQEGRAPTQSSPARGSEGSCGNDLCTANVIGQHKLSAEDMWFHTKAEILRQQNLNTAVDASWRPFPAAQQQ